MEKVESKTKRIIKRKNGRIIRLGTDWILIRVEELQGMFEEVEKVLQSGSSVVWYCAGKGAGRSMGKMLLSRFKKARSFEDFWTKFKDFIERSGWGIIKEVTIREDGGESIIRIYDNAFARRRHSTHPSCFFLKGYIEGITEILTGRHVTCYETECIAKGDPYCEFHIIVETRNKN